MRKKNAFFALLAVALATTTTAYGAGFFTNGVPVAGQSPYPSTIPLTGNETIPADTNLSGGTLPQSIAVTTQQLANYVGSTSGTSAFRNSLVNGGQDVWQRGTSFAAIANTLTYTADRWWALGGASSSIAISRQTGASDITARFGASLRFQRTAANADVAQVCVGQVLDTENSFKFQGQIAEFTFYALAGANFSPASSNVQVTIGSGTGTNGSAANFSAGAWTGYANAIQQNQAVSTTWTRYVAQASIPVGAVQVGVKICFTPVGTAGANDWVELTGLQLAVNPGGTSGVIGSAASYMPLNYEFRPISVETILAQRYTWTIAEPAASLAIGLNGRSASTTTCVVTMPVPVIMRSAPTVTFAGTALGATTWTTTFVVTNAALSTPFLAATAGGHTTGSINLTATTGAVQTAGQACSLTGAGGGSLIVASSEL